MKNMISNPLALKRLIKGMAYVDMQTGIKPLVGDSALRTTCEVLGHRTYNSQNEVYNKLLKS